MKNVINVDSNSKSEDNLYEMLDAFALEYLEAHMEPDYSISQRLQVESELVQDVKEQVKAWHKAEVAKLLQVIEDEVIGRDILMDNGTPVNHTLHNFRDRQRQALKKIKERL